MNAKRPNWLLSLVALALAIVALGAQALPASAHAAGRATQSASSTAVHTSSLSGPQSGVLTQVSNCLQAPPQSVKDRASYTPAELAKYGLPPRTPGEPLAKWQQIVRTAGQRVCSYYQTTDRMTSMQKSYNWAGNFADESTSGQTYTEADMDYYVSCISGTPPNGQYGDYAAWIGIGGVYTNSLVQTGTAGFQKFNSINGWQNTYWTWVENLGDSSDSGVHYMFAVNCGDHIYVKAWDSGSTGCMYIQRINDGKNSGNQCYGPKSDEKSGEAIVEQSYQYPNLAKFVSETFYGVGITDNGGYHGVNNLPHDYANMYECLDIHHVISSPPYCYYFGDQLASTGPINYDPGDSPYDEYTISWSNYQ